MRTRGRMHSKSAISVFEDRSLSRSRAHFWRRLGFFLTPYFVVGIVVASLVAKTGELLPVRFVAYLQTWNIPFLYGPRFSDRSYQLKLHAARRMRPEVLVLGASRMNQWRSAVFKPMSFYNASHATYKQQDYRRFIEDLGEDVPKIVIFSADFYTFHPRWDEAFEWVAYEETVSVGSPEWKKVLRYLTSWVRDDPKFLLGTFEPLYGRPALGVEAVRSASGFRIDGSYQYGGVILKDPRHLMPTLESVRDRIAQGARPFLFGKSLSDEHRREFVRFVQTARAKGIQLVGITMPYAPAIVETANQSPDLGTWGEFYRQETADWIRSQGVIYFDFTPIDRFGGKTAEFIDAFHSSEPAYIRMLITMLKDDNFRGLFPRIDQERLASRLAQATELDAFRDEF